MIRIDLEHGTSTQLIGVGNGPSQMVVSNRLDGTVSKIDPNQNAVADTLPTGEGTAGIAVGDDDNPSANAMATTVSCKGSFPMTPPGTRTRRSSATRRSRRPSTAPSRSSSRTLLPRARSGRMSTASPWTRPPEVTLITPGWVDVVSERLGNYQASPVWGLLLDQALVV